MAIGYYVSNWDGHDMTYTNGVTTLTAAEYEAMFPKITASPDEPNDPEVGDYWLDTSTP